MASDRKFAVFILTHGRPDKVETVKALRKNGYTGEIYIIIDDEDDAGDRYRELYGDKVITFNKEESAKHFDVMDLSTERRGVVYARNMCHKIASDLGLTHFLELDDDYSGFYHRYIDGKSLRAAQISNMDRVNEIMCDFLDVSGAKTVAMAQAGDFLGGADSATFRKGILRKAMNSFYCRTDRPFKFVGRINEDTNAYVLHGKTGQLFFTICPVSLVQKPTQTNSGGLTELYLDLGTYVKSFFTVMINPYAVYVRAMGSSHLRLHHHIMWEYAVPKILSDRYKKGKTK